MKYSKVEYRVFHVCELKGLTSLWQLHNRKELNWNFITANAQTMSFLYNSPQRFWIFMSKTSINFLVSLFWFFTANFVTKSKFDKALNIITRAFKWSIRLVQWIPEMWGKVPWEFKWVLENWVWMVWQSWKCFPSHFSFNFLRNYWALQSRRGSGVVHRQKSILACHRHSFQLVTTNVVWTTNL